MSEQVAVMVKAKAPAKQNRRNTITLQEYHIIRRIRQLRNQGARLAIVELADSGPRICTVGKPEG